MLEMNSQPGMMVPVLVLTTLLIKYNDTGTGTKKLEMQTDGFDRCTTGKSLKFRRRYSNPPGVIEVYKVLAI